MPETKTTNLSIRMDKKLKDEADELFSALGLTLTTAVTIFIRQAIIQRRIPFEIALGPNRKDADELRRLFLELRAEAESQGFLTDEEIEAEIKAVRAERKARGNAV